MIHFETVEAESILESIRIVTLIHFNVSEIPLSCSFVFDPTA